MISMIGGLFIAVFFYLIGILTGYLAGYGDSKRGKND